MAKSRSQVNQKRIAQEAGVSQATVSLVLTGRNVASPKTRARVLQAAERLRYRPNLLVHGMQTGKTRMIGVMAPPFDYFWSEVLYGIHDVLAGADHVPITVWTGHKGPGPRLRNGPGMNELEQIHRLLDRRVDGVILWPPFASLFQEHVREFSSRDLPIVTIDHELPDSYRADSVGSDERFGTLAVVEHLVKLGHRRFAHFAGTSEATWARSRREIFESAVRQIKGASCFTVEGPVGDPSPGIVQAREILANKPTAVFAASDLFAKLIYRAAAEIKLRIPEDLSVVGYSDHDFAAEMIPPLTTVRQDGYAVGRAAAELVLGRSTGTIRNPQPKHVQVPVELIVRQSTCQAPV
ncbi:MAG TPA: LacI family DNA-binding transcriptional regulator [Tepidisphaeraceae bacterium]|nr:LacI family DNA-binding transcriptional regulator [Tepidisphaeraceae bacterium]